MKEDVKDFKPYGLVFGSNAYNNKGERNKIYYSRSWFCKETTNIHNSEKSVFNCKYCSLKYN